MSVIAVVFVFFFFNDTATTEIYTLSLHDALPIFLAQRGERPDGDRLLPDVEVAEAADLAERVRLGRLLLEAADEDHLRSEEHTSELQSRQYLVCRLLLEKKKK